jgi:hypothetical protein
MKWGMVGLNTKIAGMVIVAILVLVLFVLAGAHAVSPSDERNQITVIKDDPKPIKRRPEDPGGMEIPFQDFEIWSIFEGSR